ncbi:MAG TPA: tetratricopeptide repeat protein, partial [Candidatus Hydrogenedentes bacterium]|nr:tetratricopeptide repeat protein [Candidatus Hydrogenedentota bacterium]
LLQVLSAPPEEQREMDPQKAAAYVTAQRDAAVSAFLWGEGLTPWNHQFAGRIGATLAAVQDYDEAVRHLERALERNPYHVPTLARLVGTRLAQAEAEMNQEPGEAAPTANPDRLLDDATRHADRMIALCPYFPIAEELKARILCLRAQSLARRDPPADRVEIEEQWRAAEAHFERAIELGAKNHIELYRFLAQVRDVLGDLEGEEEALVRAAQANPGDGALWNVFFDFAMRAEPSERLQSTLTMMIAHIANLDPPRHDAVAKGYMALARLATESRDFPRAEAAFANAARYGTEEASVWTAFAQYAHRRKRLAFFEECLGEAVRRVKETGVLTHPALAVAHLLLAEIQESQQPPVDPAIIDAAYQQAVQFAPDRPDVWSNYANFARKQDRMDALKETVTTSCRAALENGLTPLAYVRAVNDVLEEGPVALEVATETLLRQFREYPPDNARLAAVHLTWAAQLLLEAAVAAQDGDVPLCMTWLNLAIVLAGIEQYPVAEGLYPRAMQCLEGENVAVGGMQWADTLQRMGRMPEAINLLRDLLVRFPDMPDVRHACAQALARNRQIPEALQEYDVLLDVPYLPPNIVQQLEAEREALLQQQP